MDEGCLFLNARVLASQAEQFVVEVQSGPRSAHMHQYIRWMQMARTKSRLKLGRPIEHQPDGLGDIGGAPVGGAGFERAVAGHYQDGARAGTTATFDVGGFVSNEVRTR